MRSKIIYFFKIRSERRRLLAQGFLLAIYSYFLFAFFKKKVRYGADETKQPPEKVANILSIADIRFVIRVLTKNIPWEFMCRHQSWVASVLLQKRQIPYTVYIGFKKNPKGIIEGHAWTISQNIMVSGFCNPTEYTIMTMHIG